MKKIGLGLAPNSYPNFKILKFKLIFKKEKIYKVNNVSQKKKIYPAILADLNI